MSGRYIEVLGSNMHLVDAGSGDATVCFVPGNPVYSYSWRNVLPHLTGLARCLAVDLIGMGKSDKPNIDYSFADQVTYFDGLLDELAREKGRDALDNLVFVVHGWGAALGLRYAAENAGNVLGVVLIEPVVRTPVQDDMRLAEMFHTSEGEEMVLRRNWFIEEMLFKEIQRELTEAEKREYRVPFPTPESRRPILQWARSVPIDDEYPGIRDVVAGYLAWLRRTDVPKLLLHHADHPTPGMLIRREVVEELRTTLTNLREVEVGPAAHYIQEDQPERVGKEIAKWLAEIQSTHTGFFSNRKRGHDVSEMNIANPSPERLQQIVDEAACFNLIAIPDTNEPGRQILASGGYAIGLQGTSTVSRLDIDLDVPSQRLGVRATNLLGEKLGRFEHRYLVIPPDFSARPDREPPATPLDWNRSQRFSLQKCRFTFGDGTDGFDCFGTGRTFPMAAKKQPRLMAAAVASITGGFGRFQQLEGNITLCGELTQNHEFFGHVIVRVMDPGGRLVTSEPLRTAGLSKDLPLNSTVLNFVGQKGVEQNRFSDDPTGQPRGLNITTDLKRLHCNVAANGQGIRASQIKVGEMVGREIGFGPLPYPGTPPTGTSLRPFPFEGVAHYAFHDSGGNKVGAITTNVIEGRRFDVSFPEAPEEPGFRFGFFGPIISGDGCFQDVQGMFYGASGSILSPPPGHHIVTHLYAAWLHDPRGTFRKNEQSKY